MYKRGDGFAMEMGWRVCGWIVYLYETQVNIFHHLTEQ